MMFQSIMGATDRKSGKLLEGVNLRIDGDGISVYNEHGFGGYVYWDKLDPATQRDILKALGCEEQIAALEQRTIGHCAGCGYYVTGPDSEHTRTATDSDGYPYPERCGPVYPVTAEDVEKLSTEHAYLLNVTLAARSLVERIRELEFGIAIGDVPDSAFLTGAYGPELERLEEALKAWEGNCSELHNS